MKNATQYAQKIKKLLGKIKKEAQKDPPVEVNGAVETLLLGILSRSTTQKKAAEALTRLKETTVDMNDLRVTPIAEMVQIVGVSYPQARAVSEETSAVLTAIFNQVHEVDLGFLKSLGKKAAASFLDSLDGLSQHANAFFTLRHLNSSAVALDDQAYDYLVKTDHLPEGTSIEEAHKFLRTHIKESDAGTLSAALKIHARSAAGRKEMRGASGNSKKTKSAKTPRTTKTARKKAAPKTTKTRASAARTATKTKAAAKKTVTKKKHRR